MLGKFKGFYVPGKRWEKSSEAKNKKQQFCFDCKIEDCRSFSMDCDLCLFNPDSIGQQEAAFYKWYAAKGKVKYDRD